VNHEQCEGCNEIFEPTLAVLIIEQGEDPRYCLKCQEQVKEAERKHEEAMKQNGTK
jgi:hypothetical protein